MTFYSQKTITSILDQLQTGGKKLPAKHRGSMESSKFENLTKCKVFRGQPFTVYIILSKKKQDFTFKLREKFFTQCLTYRALHIISLHLCFIFCIVLYAFEKH